MSLDFNPTCTKSVARLRQNVALQHLLRGRARRTSPLGLSPRQCHRLAHLPDRSPGGRLHELALLFGRHLGRTTGGPRRGLARARDGLCRGGAVLGLMDRLALLDHGLDIDAGRAPEAGLAWARFSGTGAQRPQTLQFYRLPWFVLTGGQSTWGLLHQERATSPDDRVCLLTTPVYSGAQCLSPGDKATAGGPALARRSTADLDRPSQPGDRLRREAPPRPRRAVRVPTGHPARRYCVPRRPGALRGAPRAAVPKLKAVVSGNDLLCGIHRARHRTCLRMQSDRHVWLDQGQPAPRGVRTRAVPRRFLGTDAEIGVEVRQELPPATSGKIGLCYRHPAAAPTSELATGRER
ncbi:MAG: hypothetical protein QOH16_702 [Gaiellaceae bacterium]|nr:hypothetical protein [Gaiellaceae bacterium]